MMAEDECQGLQDLIAALAEGRFDVLSPDEVAALEAHLNECGACAARLATARAAPPDAGYPEPPAGPEAGVWDAVWNRIDKAAMDSRPVGLSGGRARWLRSWGAISAAAAILLATAIWHLVPLRPAPAWEFRLAGAHDVEIESLEVFGEATTFVLNTDDDVGTSIIWVMEENGETSG
jgi:hypothetical protein